MPALQLRPADRAEEQICRFSGLNRSKLLAKRAEGRKTRGSFLSCKLAHFYPEPMWRYLDLFHMSDLAWPRFDVCHCDFQSARWLKYIRGWGVGGRVCVCVEGGKMSRLCVQKVQKHPQKKKKNSVMRVKLQGQKGDWVINQYPTAAY